MASAILVARALSPNEYAEYSYFQITAAMISTVSVMGLGVTASKYFAQSVLGPAPVGAILAIGTLLAAVAGVVIYIVPTTWFGAGFEISSLLLALAVGALIFGVVPTGAIIGLQRFKSAAVVSAVSGVATLGGTMLSVDMGSLNFALIAFIVGALLQAVGNLAVVVHVVGVGKLTSISGFRSAKSLIGTAGPMFVVSIMSASTIWLVGRIVLLGSGGVDAFALYSIGAQWFSLGLLVPGMLSRVVLPSLLQHPGRSAEIIKGGISLATGSCAAVAIVGSILSPFFMGIYGENYSDNKWLLVPFLLAAVISAPQNIFGNFLISQSKEGAWLRLSAVGFLATITAAAIFRESGAIGAAMAHACGAGVLLLLCIKLLRRQHG